MVQVNIGSIKHLSQNRSSHILLIACFIFFGCSPIKLDNPCDPNSESYNKTLLLKALSMDRSTHCGLGGGNVGALSSSKDITSYTIPSLGITGIIRGNQISLSSTTITSFTPFVASFATTGKSVAISSVVQASGGTSNSYSSNLIYTVTAEDGTTQNFTVTLSAPLTYGGSSLRIWLNADSLGLADGAQVTTWADLSGFGNHFTQPTSIQKPIFKTNQVNGYPSLRFTSVASSRLDIAGGVGFYVNNSGSFFVVIKFNQNVGGGNSILNLSLGSGRQYDIGSAPNVSFTPGKNAVGYVTSAALLIPMSTYIAIGSIQVLTTSQNEIWNGDIKDNYSGLGTLLATDYASGGGGYVSNAALDADIAELMFFNTALSQNETDKIFCYLRNKYNLTATTTSCGI